MKKALLGVICTLVTAAFSVPSVSAQGIVAVQTGDDFKIGLWIGIAAAALAVAFVVTLVGKKKEAEQPEEDEEEQSE